MAADVEKLMISSEEVMGQAAGWRDAGKGVAIATVVNTWGSSPRPIGSQLAVSDVDAGCVTAGVGLDAPVRHRLNDRALQRHHQFPHDQPAAAQIQHHVDDELARSVVGHLSAPVDRDNGNIPRREHVGRIAVHALGKYRRMLQAPEFVRRVGSALVG